MQILTNPLLRCICTALSTHTNKACFNFEHLQIGTPRENALDVVRAGSKKIKLSEECVKKIYLQKNKVTATSLANEYNVDLSTILSIWKKTGEKWDYSKRWKKERAKNASLRTDG